MPQLDINTFFYQYVGIIILLLSVYYLLSYIVLPVTMRAVIFRSRFLDVKKEDANSILLVVHDIKDSVALTSRAIITIGAFRSSLLLNAARLFSKLLISNGSNNQFNRGFRSRIVSSSTILGLSTVYLVLFFGLDDLIE
jgi:hypothetical protein